MNKESFLKTLETLAAPAFGIAYWLYDLRVATVVLIVYMTLFVALVKFLGEKLTKIQLVSWLTILILGGASVSFQDESIIKWKPTVINTVIGLTFLISQVIGKKTLVERFTEEKVPAPAFMLRKVNFAAGLFYLALAPLNIFIAQNYSTTVWMNFKIFGMTALNTIFFGSCLYYLKAYLHNLFPPDPTAKK